MDSLGRTIPQLVLIIVFSLFLIFSLSTSASEGENPYPSNEEVLPKKPSIQEMLKSTFSLYKSIPVPTKSYWNKVQTLLSQVQSVFFRPNLDFRGSEEVEATGGGGAGEKVKEAVAKSFGKGKAAVEESAKSAAELAGDTVHKAAEKVKRSLSDKKGGQVTNQAEL